MEPNVYHGRYTPLHRAILEQQADSVAALLAQGAHPNSEVLGDGFTALDLAVARGALELIPLLVRAGGRPGRRAWLYRDSPEHREAVAALDRELERNRAVEVAQELALTPWRVQEARRLLDEGATEEAAVLLEPVRGWGRDTEDSLHLRIRALIATDRRGEAMEEAAFAFAMYRDAGRYRQALMVAREMRKIDPRSPRPYELELRFLLGLGCKPEAAHCQDELLALHRDDPTEQAASARRYRLLLRGEGKIPRPRRVVALEPSRWEGPSWFGGGNLPAPAAPSMEEWERRFLGGRSWDGIERRPGVLVGEAAWQRFATCQGVLNVWEEYAPVAERRRVSRPELRPGTYVYPDDQSWSLAVRRDGLVLFIELP